MPHRRRQRMGRLGQPRAEVAAYRRGLPSTEQSVESPDDPGSAHLRRPSIVQVHYLEWKDRYSGPLRHADSDFVVWHYGELSAGRKLQSAAVFDLAGQSELPVLVKVNFQTILSVPYPSRFWKGGNQ